MSGRLWLAALLLLISGPTLGVSHLAGPHWEPTWRRPALLQFWASWCGGCAGVASAIGELQLDDQVVRVAISIDEHREDAVRAAPAIEKAGGDALVVVYDDTAELARRHAVLTAPTLVLLDADGAERWRFQGHPTATEIADLVKAVEDMK